MSGDGGTPKIRKMTWLCMPEAGRKMRLSGCRGRAAEVTKPQGAFRLAIGMERFANRRLAGRRLGVSPLSGSAQCQLGRGLKTPLVPRGDLAPSVGTDMVHSLRSL